MRQTERLDRQFAKYQLVQRIADGRMGEVFKAKSEGVEGFEKILCVKILYPRLVREDAFVETVIEEAKRAVSLSHANVAQVLDLGQDDDSGRYYIASEHINGLDLGQARTIAREAGREWPRDLSLFIASEVAKALDYAHRRKDFNFNNLNLLHRDVTPNNILISFDGEVKLTDFGLSRAFDNVPVSREDDPDRRYLYAPPEHARGAEYTRASDIFSLGLVTYEMLTGSHPYTGDGKPMRESATQADFPPIGDVLAVPTELEQLLDSMLKTDPETRLDNAGTAYEKLVEFLFQQDLRSDNRALSNLMTELRQLGSEMESVASSASDESLDEISHADVESFYERSEVELAGNGQKSNEELPEMPGGLNRSLQRARDGRGQAILMSGQFGLGRRYLPDRLADVLSDQQDARSIVLHRSQDDRLRPWGLIADLLETLADETADRGIRSSVDRSTLSLIESLGGSDAVVRLLAELWGIEQYRGYEELLPPEQSIDQQIDAVLQRWMRRIDRDEDTVVIVIDRIERTDRRSLRAIRRMFDWMGEHSVLIVMSTKAEESMRETFDVGQPDALRAVHVGASEVTDRGDIPELSDETARVLLALSLLDRPVRRSSIQQILDIDRSTLDDSAESLVEHGLVREPRAGSLLSAATDAELSLRERFSSQQLQQMTRRLLRFLDDSTPGKPDAFSRTAPIRLRLRAVSRNRNELRRAAASYEGWLVRFGCEPIAADLYNRLAQTLNLFPVGDPRLHLDALARATHYSLVAGALSTARQTLEPLSARADNESFGALADLLRGRILLVEDDLAEAERVVHRAARRTHRSRSSLLHPRSTLLLARLARRFGDLPLARRRISQTANLSSTVRHSGLGTTDAFTHEAISNHPHEPLNAEWRAHFLTEKTAIELELDAIRAAYDTASELAAVADAFPAPSVQLRSDLIDGLLYLEDGKERAANHRFDRVVQRATDLGLELLALQALLAQADLAYTTDQYEYLASRADILETRASSNAAVYLEQRAREYRALADALQSQRLEQSVETLRRSLARAEHREIPRDIVRCLHMLSTALEAADDDVDGAERHRQRADRIARSFQLPADSPVVYS